MKRTDQEGGNDSKQPTASAMVKAAATSIASVDSERRRMVLGAIAGAAVSGPGCASIDQPKRMSWKEEVQLHDGRVIVVEQSREIEWRYNGSKVGPLPVKSRLTYRGPERRLVVYEGEIRPLIFDVVGAVTYLAGPPITLLAFGRLGSPRSGWVAYRLDDMNRWARIKVHEVPESIRVSNLFRPSLPRSDGVMMTLGWKSEGRNNKVDGIFASEFERLDPSARAGWGIDMDERFLGE